MPSIESRRALPYATDLEKELLAVAKENPIPQAQPTVADSAGLEWNPNGR
jgi:hypothetical protein